jgi:hypothetical protein
MSSTYDPAVISAATRSWQPETRQAMAEYLRTSRAREQIKAKYRNAAELAQAVDPGYNITPALRMVADAIETVLSRPRHNLLVTTPPQEGKSSLCAVYTPLRALQLNPNRRIILATYGDSLAEDHSRSCRDIITRHGAGVVDAMTGVTVEDKLGLELSPTASKIGSWRIAGARGGMIAVGLGSSITGRAADLFIIDDPYKNMQEADSATHRRRVDEWFASVAQTRLSPEASMVLIQCMTGDTPVLRPDGSETPLRDIRVGDRIATYENGTVTTSTVLNWASQGSDDVMCIRMKSGRTVRANARHPFLTSEGAWVRVAELKPGQSLMGIANGTAPESAHPTCCEPQPTIWADEIISIEPCGVEEVFDIQVERTENFIANGLVSHNTRWHPEDLAGQIIAGEQQVEPRYRTWRHINVPAISEAGIYDSLGRNDDEVMVSARGRTRDEFEQTRRKVGERVWYALYQGSPRNPAGGLFMRAWFDNTRLPVAPDKTVATVIGIDPADSGEGDETGIVAATLAEDGTVILTEDWSGQMTADEWARRAVMLALNTGAREIAMEAYASATTYVSVIKRAWKDIHDEVVAKRTRGNYLSPIEERALSANMPFTIFKWRGRNGADAVGRSSLLRQAFETGKCKTVENKLAVFEAQAADWQAGQHQPDRVAAALIAHDRIAALSGGRVLMSVPVDGPPTAAPAWLKRRIG